MFKEFREFPNPEEADFDIKYGFNGDEENATTLPNNLFDEEAAIELSELIGLLEDDEYENIEELYGITQYEYMHPSKEVIQKVREYQEGKGKRR